MPATARVCVDCKKMDVPPKPPRRIYEDKPRSPRCYTHFIVKRNIARAKAKEYRQERTYGLNRKDYDLLAAEQNGKCVCGRNYKHTDHDHRIARAECDHPEERACKRCLRGLLCYVCNTDILGRGYTPAMLRALADYLENPPARRVFNESGL